MQSKRKNGNWLKKLTQKYQKFWRISKSLINFKLHVHVLWLLKQRKVIVELNLWYNKLRSALFLQVLVSFWVKTLNFKKLLNHLISFGKTDTLKSQCVSKEDFLSNLLLLLCLLFPSALYITVLVNPLI